jgi:hypothetical protein
MPLILPKKLREGKPSANGRLTDSGEDGRCCLEAALEYAANGYPVFPCRPGTKKPLTRNGFKNATTDAETIKGWGSRWPAANVAIDAAGLLVLAGR